MLLALAQRFTTRFKINRKLTKSKFGINFKPFHAFIPFVALLVFTCVFAKIFYEIEIAFCPTKWGSLEPYSNSSKSLTYWKAFHYVAIIDTTIGFGDIEPCSVFGQLFTILTASFGIPLTLFCLTRLGRTFEFKLNQFWLFIKKHPRRKAKIYTTDSISVKNEDEEQENEVNDQVVIIVPLSFGLFVTFLWILFCSVYFYFTLRLNYEHKNFTIFTAFYFTMVTFLTIGLGDVAPTQYEYILITYSFIMIGLALVTMCIDILQDRLESLFNSIVKLIHDQYQNSVSQGENHPIMSENVEGAKNNVKELLNKDNKDAWVKHFLSKKEKRKLIMEYQSKAKMKVKGTQHDIVYNDKTTLTETEYADKEMITDPNVSSVDCRSIGVNCRVSHLQKVGYFESIISS